MHIRARAVLLALVLVVDSGKLVGIFTDVDAVKLLSRALSG